VKALVRSNFLRPGPYAFSLREFDAFDDVARDAVEIDRRATRRDSDEAAYGLQAGCVHFDG
jgi:hypothetical protein